MIHEEKIGKRIWDSCFREKLGRYLEKNIEDIVYKRVYGEEENVEIDGKSYTILPIGNINRSIQGLLDGTIPHNNGIHSFTGARRILSHNLQPITVKDAKINRIRASYIKHYHDTLGEVWSEKDFDDKLGSLKYVTQKYAIDEETKETIVVGFFGVKVETGAGGAYLTNGELYVLPEFRGRGIAKELVHQTFELALADGITNFDSLTYRVPGNDPLTFWNNIGANETGLFHIAGAVDEMYNATQRNKDDQLDGNNPMLK